MNFLKIRHAAEHNLKNVDVDIPHGRMTVVTGVSGSGKSSLVFDVVYHEARRRYLETFSTYARQFMGKLQRPEVGLISGLAPAVAVGQRTSAAGPRSTVGTLTEIYDDLRLLFARLGFSPDGILLSRRMFSFNSIEGACPSCRGLGLEDRIDPELLISDPARSLRQGALTLTTPNGYIIYSQVTMDVLDPARASPGDGERTHNFRLQRNEHPRPRCKRPGHGLRRIGSGGRRGRTRLAPEKNGPARAPRPRLSPPRPGHRFAVGRRNSAHPTGRPGRKRAARRPLRAR